MVVLNSLPSLGFNVLLDSIGITINAETDDSDIFTPLLLVLSKHLLVVSHRSLARRAPSSPQIIQDDLTFLVLDSGLAFLEDVVSILNRSNLITNTNLGSIANLLVSWLNTLEYLINILRNFGSQCGLISLENALGLENEFSFKRFWF